MLGGMLSVSKCSVLLHYHFSDGTFFSGALEVPFLIISMGIP